MASIGSTAGGGKGRTTTCGRDAHEATNTSGMSARYFIVRMSVLRLRWLRSVVVYGRHRKQRSEGWARRWFFHRRMVSAFHRWKHRYGQSFGGRRDKIASHSARERKNRRAESPRKSVAHRPRELSARLQTARCLTSG